MTHNLVIYRFSEQRYMILNLFIFFGTPGRTWSKGTYKLSEITSGHRNRVIYHNNDRLEREHL